MILSQKSLNFAKKILKYNPLLPQHQHKHQDNSHNHQNCQHSHNSQIKPYLHVHDHRKQRQIYQKSTKQKLQCMRTFKDQGNQHFKFKRYQQAAHYYNKIIIFSDYTFPEVEKEQKQMQELVQQASCNLGITLFKLGQNKKAIDNFNQGLKGPIVKTIIKSLYWLIKCSIKEDNYKKSEQYLERLKQYGEITKNEVSQLEQQLKNAKQNYQKKSKSVYGKMFANQRTNKT